jgi:hypothetical protein
MLSPEEADELAHEFFQVLIQEFEWNKHIT